MQPLPIDKSLPAITQLLEQHNRLVLKASPGSGKTTRLPPYLLQSSLLKSKKVLVLEPRRLAAKLAARRVAEENHWQVGKEVGYQFRFEKRTTASTRLIYLTEGTFVRQLLGNSQLPDIGCVVLDEFHERHLHTDVALTCLLKLQQARPDLRLILTSATLDHSRLLDHLSPCEEFTLETERFPVSLHYLEKPPTSPMEKLVSVRVSSILKENPSHTLVFLPGLREIRACEQALQSVLSRQQALICPLHGELDRKEQDRAILPSTTPKIILSTNIAESSLTIEGIGNVIDSGLHRQASFSWWLGLPALTTRKISRASATQRMGRAGRTGAGHCFRLYTQSDHDGRPQFDLPEIQRTDLTQTLLELYAIGHPPESLPWFEAPPKEALVKAQALLKQLGAIEEGKLTPLGQEITRLPLPPRLARVYLAGKAQDCALPALVLGNELAENRVRDQSALEFLSRLQSPASTTQKLIRQLGEPASGWQSFDPDTLARCLFTGFADRVAKKRSEATSERVDLVLSSGDSATVDRTALVEQDDYFLALSARETKHGTRRRVHAGALVPIQEDWLLEEGAHHIQEKEELSWNAKLGRVETYSALTYGQIELTSSRGPARPSFAAQNVWLKEILGTSFEALNQSEELEWLHVFENAGQKEGIDSFLGKWELLKAQPDLMPRAWEEVRQQVLESWQVITQKKQWLDLDWESLLSEVTAIPLHELSQLLPQKYRFPNGRHSKIDYCVGTKPKLGSKLQDFFGVRESPTILKGRVPLLLELRAPNQRAVQLTQDLTGFWRNSYVEVRKELKRRYPKHPWPENPLEFIKEK